MNSEQKIKKLIRQKELEITEQEKFTNPRFKTYLQVLVDSVMLNVNDSPTVFAEYSSNKNVVAYTNGNDIHLNTANKISRVYTLESSRLLALIGILYHECAHIRYLNFEAENKIIKAVQEGKLYGTFKADNVDDEQNVIEIKNALNNPLYCKIFGYVYHQLSNIFSDVHDEGKLCDEFHGIVEKSIIYSTEALRSTSVSVEEMTKELENNLMDKLSVMFSLMLIYARYGKVVTENEEKAYSENEYLKKLVSVQEYIRNGCKTDNLIEKYTAINQCVLTLWPYIKEMTNPDTNSASENSSSDTQKTDSDDSNGENTASSSDGSQSETQSNSSGSENSQNRSDEQESSKNNSSGAKNGNQENNASEKTTENSSDDNKSQNNENSSGNDTSQSSEQRQNQGSGDSNSAKSSSGQCSINEDTAKSVMDSLANAASKSIPNASPEPKDMKNNNSKKEQKKDVSATNHKGEMNDVQAQSIVQNLLDNITREMAKEQAGKEYEKQNQSDINAIINSVSMTSSHKGLTTFVSYLQEPSDADIKEYNAYMKELAPISKSLQKQILDILRDLKDGSIQKHRSFGKRIEARDTYRIDGKYFSNKKLPQDLPDMAVMVLLDQSGSTRGERIEAERKAAMLLYDFAEGLDIPIMICGHHATGRGTGIQFYPYVEFENINPKAKYKLAQISSSLSGNRDGMAINIAAELLSKRPEEVKLLLILSDGQPYDANYGGDAAKEDIRSIVKMYKHKGIQTIATAIGDDKERIAEIYKDGYLDLSDLSALPKSLAKIVKKRII